jgi:hypothetical protein
MDPFTPLPPELIQQILSHIPDFVGFESLLSTSPWVQNVFRSHPRHITLNLIRTNSMTTPEIQNLLYNIATIHTPSIHCDDIDIYIKLCPTTSTSTSTSTTTEAKDWSPLNPYLPDNMSTSQIMRIIHIAANIQRLACACLSEMQTNFIAAVEMSRGVVAAQRAAEPTVWIEEVSVYWALWHLQHYSAIQYAAKYRWNWSEERRSELRDTYMERGGDIAPQMREFILAVAGVLGEMGLLLDGNGKQGHRVEEKDLYPGDDQFDQVGWNIPAEEPIAMPFFASLEAEIPTRLQVFDSEQGGYVYDFPIWSPAALPNDDCPAERVWNRTSCWRLRGPVCGTMMRSYTWQFMRRCRIDCRQAGRNLKYAPPWRRVGVAVWSKWRMYSVGLCASGLRGMGMSMEIRTPDGDVLGKKELQYNLEMREVVGRWLALIDKALPGV